MIENTRNVMSQLKLYGMLSTLDLRLGEAEQHGWSYSDLVSALITDESFYKKQRSTIIKIKRARFRLEANFDRFDYTLKRTITRAQVKELMELTFIKKGQTLILVGPTGVGKTFLATATGYHACSQGYDCQFLGMSMFIEQAQISRATGTYLKFRERLIACDLLIIDDLGIKPLPPVAIQDFYDILEERYQNKSTIITTQLPLNNWKEIIEDEVALEAIIDRIIHGQKIEIEGDSYRKKRAIEKEEGK